MDDAACRGHTELFFNAYDDEDRSLRVEFGRSRRILAAKRMCRTCPVQPDCLEWALQNKSSHRDALLGGKTWSERKKILAARTKVKRADSC